MRAVERDTFRINLHTLRVMKYIKRYGQFKNCRYRSGTRLRSHLYRHRDTFLFLRRHELLVAAVRGGREQATAFLFNCGPTRSGCEHARR